MTAYHSFCLRKITSFELKFIHREPIELHVPVQFVSEAISGEKLNCTTNRGQNILIYDQKAGRIFIKLHTATTLGFGYITLCYEITENNAKKELIDFINSRIHKED